MSEAQLFRLGAEVRCSDGDCGKIKSLVIDPGDDAVTHLVVEPAHRQGPGRLVPLRLVDTAVALTPRSDVRLRCTVAEFRKLDPAEATQLFPNDGEDYEVRRREPPVSWPYYAPQGAMAGEVTRVVTVDAVPDQLPGEDEVTRGQQVHATDGDAGHVQGILVDGGSGCVTSVLLREGHLMGRRSVLIPRSAVAEVGADGFHLRMSREQVQNLPPADIGHPVG